MGCVDYVIIDVVSQPPFSFDLGILDAGVRMVVVLLSYDVYNGTLGNVWSRFCNIMNYDQTMYGHVWRMN